MHGILVDEADVKLAKDLGAAFDQYDELDDGDEELPPTVPYLTVEADDSDADMVDSVY